jgi:hypothetical protein
VSQHVAPEVTPGPPPALDHTAAKAEAQAATAYPKATRPRFNFGRLTAPQRVSGVAILVVVLAAFLPWVAIFGIGLRGIEGDGRITLVLALAGAVILTTTSGLVGSRRTPGRASQIPLLVLAALAALVALVDMNGAAAMGLYLTLLGGIAWVVGAAWQLSLTKQAHTSPADGPQNQV